MVDRYYRKIEDVENDIENAMQISSILLKLKENDKKLEGLSKIDTNENDISSNLGKINNNSSTISTNFKQISRNTGDISSNLKQISTNTSSISTNLRKINTNVVDISTNSGQISNISSNLKQISTNTESISTNSGKIDNFTQYILQSGKDFEEKYTIEKQIFKFNKDKHFYTIFEKEIEYDFTKNSLLFVKNNMHYKYDNLSNDYYRSQHEYNIYDGDNLIHKYLFNKDTYYNSLDPILHTNEDFCICFKKNYKKIRLNLQLHRHNRHGTGNINLEIDDNENCINIDYVDRNNNGNDEKISTNLEKINTNVADISSNLGIINTNKSNIASNLKKITTNASNLEIINNITKTIMLKNIYFTDFDSKNEALVRDLLHFDTTIKRARFTGIHRAFMKYYFKKDDIIEIDCKLLLSHSTYEYANYISLFYTLFERTEIDANKTIFREVRRYNQFPLVVNKNRIIAYTKLCYKVKYDMDDILFFIQIGAPNQKNMNLILSQFIIEYGVNYISIKHYGKS